MMLYATHKELLGEEKTQVDTIIQESKEIALEEDNNWNNLIYQMQQTNEGAQFIIESLNQNKEERKAEYDLN